MLIVWFCKGINDGAAALVLWSNRTAKLKQQVPLAKIVSWAQAGIDPLLMVNRLFEMIETIVAFLFVLLGFRTNKSHS